MIKGSGIPSRAKSSNLVSLSTSVFTQDIHIPPFHLGHDWHIQVQSIPSCPEETAKTKASTHFTQESSEETNTTRH